MPRGRNSVAGRAEERIVPASGPTAVPPWLRPLSCPTCTTSAASPPSTTCRATPRARSARHRAGARFRGLIPRMLLDVQNRGQLSAGMTSYHPDRRAAAGNVPRAGERQRGVPAEPSRQGREHHGAVRRAGGDRPRSLRHVRPGRPQLCPAVRAASFAEAQMVQLCASMGNWPTTPSCATSCWPMTTIIWLARTDTEIIMHEISRELSGDRRPPLVDVMRNVAQAVRRGVLHRVSERSGRHARRPRSAGDPAAVLRDRRTAVGRGERERGAAEPRLFAREHSLARAGAR